MAGPYFHNSSWAPFIYQGETFSLEHLKEFEFTVVDTDNLPRKIAVTFADHCFTRQPESVEDTELVYPDSDRQPVGHFCFERYELSLRLVEHITCFSSGNVWTVDGDNFSALPTVDSSGKTVLYGIIFSLDKVSGLPVDLHMRIKSAYALNEGITTFGKVRFRHLVALRMKHKKPGRIVGSHRKAPRA